MGGFVGASAGAGLSGNPLLLAPPAIGEGAKHLSNMNTRRIARELAKVMRSVLPVPSGRMSDGAKRVLLFGIHRGI